MKTHIYSIWLLVLFCLAAVVSIDIDAAQDESTIDPEAENLIRKLSVKSRTIAHFEFDVMDTMDKVRETGQKIQVSHRRSGIVSRPDKLRVDTTGDTTNRGIWKNSKTFTLLDRDHNVYGQVDAPGTIDETIDMLMDKFGVRVPLADLLSSNLNEILMKNVTTGEYVGLHTVGDIKCHHLAFTQDTIDWQIWIDAGDILRLRKLVITYKLEQSQPQYSLVVKNIKELSVPPAEKVFEFTPPEGVTKIQILKDVSDKRISEDQD